MARALVVVDFWNAEMRFDFLNAARRSQDDRLPGALAFFQDLEDILDARARIVVRFIAEHFRQTLNEISDENASVDDRLIC
ncbi:MAG TPA: hypothetical protein VFO29_11890 [Candidatus Rubrimentiphilum sp.]|nr:hypothetical protein [Candidatus Rubrimentiphilum sp.]